MLFVLCGIPGSGKTTLSRTIAEQHSAILYCYDELPNAHLQSRRHEVHVNMWGQMADDLRAGHTVVLDELHITRAMRTDMLSALDGIDCKKTLIVMQTPLDVCIQRNANRARRLPEHILRRCKQMYEPPQMDEGWTEIIYYPFVNDSGTITATKVT